MFRHGISRSFCGMNAAVPVASFGVFPFIVILPLYSVSRQVIRRNSVLFPQPDAPITVIISFFSAENDRSSSRR